jgi:hypothetical protein
VAIKKIYIGKKEGKNIQFSFPLMVFSSEAMKKFLIEKSV